MQLRVRHPDIAEEYWFEERCYILESWNVPEDEAVSIARARVPPGVTTRTHYLTGVQERYLLVSGAGEVRVGDLGPQSVGPGDVVIIPPGVAQSIANTGAEDLVFYAICTPRFVPECYHALAE